MQTLSLGQGGTPVSLTSGQIPNLQSVTVNSVGQFQQSEDTDSTGGTSGDNKLMFSCLSLRNVFVLVETSSVLKGADRKRSGDDVLKEV